jgi:hypothetical protein
VEVELPSGTRVGEQPGADWVARTGVEEAGLRGPWVCHPGPWPLMIRRHNPNWKKTAPPTPAILRALGRQNQRGGT